VAFLQAWLDDEIEISELQVKEARSRRKRKDKSIE